MVWYGMVSYSMVDFVSYLPQHVDKDPPNLLSIDKEPPTVVSCPNATKVIAPDRLTQVFWTEPVFTDNKVIASITKSHRPGSTLTWGDYIVTYIASDASGNSASCTFELYVSSKLDYSMCNTSQLRNLAISGIYPLCPFCIFYKYGFPCIVVMLFTFICYFELFYCRFSSFCLLYVRKCIVI